MKQNLLAIITQLLETAWRRRMLIALPILVMLPLSIVGARFLQLGDDGEQVLFHSGSPSGGVSAFADCRFGGAYTIRCGGSGSHLVCKRRYRHAT